LIKKYEEMEEDERNKLRELLKETSKKGKEESADGGTKLDWMYKGNKKDTEEYLLGRRIDNAVTAELTEEVIQNDAPGAKFSEVMNRRSDIDMQVKMREDPLYAIRKREEDAKRKLLENPIRMKQLQKTIEERQKIKKKKKVKKTKKTKKQKKLKKKKSKKSDSDSSSSDDDDDDDLLQKYLAIVESKKQVTAPSKASEDSRTSDRRRERRPSDKDRSRSASRDNSRDQVTRRLVGNGHPRSRDRESDHQRESMRGNRRDQNKMIVEEKVSRREDSFRPHDNRHRDTDRVSDDRHRGRHETPDRHDSTKNNRTDTRASEKKNEESRDSNQSQSSKRKKEKRKT